MCITTTEATAMIEEAKKRDLMLTVFHNRRYDGPFLAIKEVIDKGLIGKIFHLEYFGGVYEHPGHWWRSDKKISGGAIYDGGAHIIDWVLNFIPERIAGVAGFFHKLVWNDVTNEDQVEALIRFESGTVADVQISSIASINKPRWRILGTKGGILDEGGKEFFKVITQIEGIPAEMNIKYKIKDWSAYYRNIADHLFMGTELKVKPEEARRVIAVMETAEKSAKSGRIENVPYE
jgi:predicted dehydrogenase